MFGVSQDDGGRHEVADIDQRNENSTPSNRVNLIIYIVTLAVLGCQSNECVRSKSSR
jgi:hypothetical protein